MPRQRVVSDDSGIEYVDAPPPTKRGSHRKSQHMKYLDAARAQPGSWVVIRSTSTSTAANIRAGKYQDITKGEFVVETRVAEPVGGKKRVDVYVCYPSVSTNGHAKKRGS